MSLDKFTINNAYDSIEVFQGTSPWVIGDGGGSITVDATDLDVRDLTHVSDSIKIGDGTDFLAIAADGSIAVTDNGGSLTVDGTVTVTATDLDIRDLTHVSDSVKVGDGTDFLAIAADGSIAVTDNGGSLTVDGTVTVTATDLDIRDITHVSDSVKVGDGTDFLAVNGDGSINAVVSGAVSTTPDAYDVWKSTTDVAITASAGGTQVVAAPLANRLKIIVQNIGANDVRLAESTTQVTSTRGIFLKRGLSQEIELGAGADLWALGIGGASTLTVVEYAS